VLDQRARTVVDVRLVGALTVWLRLGAAARAHRAAGCDLKAPELRPRLRVLPSRTWTNDYAHPGRRGAQAPS
jgi:hypothetical protein